MSQSEQVAELLLRWEELAEQGQPISAADLCRECPELLPEVRAKIQALQAMYQVPNRLNETIVDPDGRTPSAEGLPQIPGYEVLGLLGRGGMGKVYKARQLGLNRLVALKMILSGVHAHPVELARFRTEAEAGARLQHPNIVQIYEVDEYDGVPFLALEYVAGASLEQRLHDQPLPPRQAAELVATLAGAVHHAHQQGIVHRDLKPANVLLADSKEPWQFSLKVTDFGLAKKLDEIGQTQTGAVLGTPSYMAPEQAAGRVKDIGPATDVYALGVILYEALTGRPPFVASSLMETLEQVRSQEPTPLRHLEPKVPRPLEVICLKCLAKEPERRYPSAKALAADLERYLNGEWIEARGESLVGRLTRLLDRSQSVGRVRGLSRFYIWGIFPLPLVAALVLYLTARTESFYPEAALIVFLGSCLVMVAAVYFFQRRRMIVQTAQLHRQFWAIRIGALLAMTTVTVLSYLLTPPGLPWNALGVFPLWSVLGGMMFFVLGGIFWGRLFLLGLIFFLASLLMTLHLPLAPVLLGLLLSGTLGLIARKADIVSQEQVER